LVFSAVNPLEMVIFDNDGVLIDSEKLAARSNAELLTSLGYPTTAEDCEARFTGISDRAMQQELLDQGYTLPKDFIQQMYAVSEHAFETELEPIYGVRAVIENLISRRVKVAVASNAPRVNVLKNLRTTGYDDLLTPDLCFSGLDVPNPKPAPDLHQHILAHFEQSPETALVIEDSPAGAKGACAAGVRFIGVLYAVADHMKARRIEEFRDLGALAILESPEELGKTLDSYIS
jgi:HAD superfamily hydrolase (TIGR01509 family)